MRNIALFGKPGVAPRSPEATADSEAARTPALPPPSAPGSGDAPRNQAPMAPPVPGLVPAVPSDGDAHWQTLRLENGKVLAVSELPQPPSISVRQEETPGSFFHLFATMERIAADRPVVGVTSAIPAEGKTTIALHLALAMAQSSFRRVCLVDLSLGEDELCRRVGASPSPGGVIAYLEGAETFPVLNWPGTVALSLVPAGKVPINPARSARSPRIAELVASLRAEYDAVVVDLPPVSSDNAASLAQNLDGVILVARAGATPRSLIRHALDILGRSTVAGVVLNRVTTARRARRPRGAK